MPNELVAQSYLAAVLRNPADARARKYKVWGDLYNEIFSGDRVEPYIIATLISRYVSDWLRNGGKTESEDELIRSIAKRGGFHLTRIIAYLWRNGDHWKRTAEDLASEIAELEKEFDTLAPDCEMAFEILRELIVSNDYYSGDIDRALKSYTLDQDIEKKLYTMDKKSA